ncbi:MULTISPECIES: putative glutamine/gamma-aminobutyrate antiporter GadC [Duncaniella]|uniref:putative glutamine/gamma-aminobutyrate antiporter GadC n=1 Tax=Duncaniella TaxID=2518495 RepID=UPI000F49E439|nr:MULTISPECIES: putative glutamine/gamma-aminobutyrate antiporter GadC [Duncaniella]ROS97049.1 amino acid permease [Muribaculaceae bacterium Isolate-077 (Janvier)]ROS99714.1 amino acid permease [Muribaculaceae bacterium Isolate-083 (Janvier)]ROT00975.1 amino acid permease [Muribaculaceae bacterium Isolate-084 (Janvier)]QCD38240.1 amino acid permease [Duncaniella sp. C9]QCP71928.1 amino acid permease [Duncaniella sp. B8]
MANSNPSKPGPQAKGGKAPQALISTGAMTVMIITTVVSLRGLPSQAEFGIQSIFYYLFAAIVFLIPFSLVCAELASTYTHSGGLYRWVAEAFGPKWGWTAMYLEWQTLVIWFPAVLMFAAVSLAYIFWPESFDARLSANKIYTLVVVLAVYWITNFIAFRGMKSSKILSTLGGLFGTIVPGAILIILGVAYLCMGKPIMLAHESFFPDFSKIGTIVLAASIFLFYGGMEMNAVHVQNMKNPARQFPRAIFLAVAVIVLLFVFATLAIGFVVPAKDINLLASLLVAYNDLWAAVGVPWLGNVMALLITFGVIGQVSVIIAGPSTGLVAVGESGYLPRSLQKTNAQGVNKPILYVQAIFVSLLSLVLVVLPSVESAYQVMSQMATVIYLILVLMIYFAFIRLRHTQPQKQRGFRIPGGKLGEVVVAGIGILGAVVAMVLSFFPPSQINTGSPVVYVLIIFCGALLFFCVPLIVFSKRKPSWRNPKANFYPFDWQIENRRPSEVSKWSPTYQPTPAQIAGTDARILAEENGATPAEAEKIAAEAEKAYDGSENPQAEAYDILDKDKGTGA